MTVSGSEAQSTISASSIQLSLPYAVQYFILSPYISIPHHQNILFTSSISLSFHFILSNLPFLPPTRPYPCPDWPNDTRSTPRQSSLTNHQSTFSQARLPAPPFCRRHSKFPVPIFCYHIITTHPQTPVPTPLFNQSIAHSDNCHLTLSKQIFRNNGFSRYSPYPYHIRASRFHAFPLPKFFTLFVDK